MQQYEPTYLRLQAPKLSEEQEQTIRKAITKQDILPGAFVLQNFLSPKECELFILQAETLGLRSCGYDPAIRQTDRVAAQSLAVARMLFDRLAPYLEPIDLSQSERPPVGIPTHARKWKWNPVELNEAFRICRYEAGGFFLPHRDGGFKRSEFNRSLKTFMVYLNDGFEGGDTHFYSNTQPCYERGDPDKVVYTYKPQRGDVVVFNSEIIHDGGKLIDGQKFIFRSEVMYRPE